MAKCGAPTDPKKYTRGAPCQREAGTHKRCYLHHDADEVARLLDGIGLAIGHLATPGYPPAGAIDILEAVQRGDDLRKEPDT